MIRRKVLLFFILLFPLSSSPSLGRTVQLDLEPPKVEAAGTEPTKIPHSSVRSTSDLVIIFRGHSPTFMFILRGARVPQAVQQGRLAVSQAAYLRESSLVYGLRVATPPGAVQTRDSWTTRPGVSQSSSTAASRASTVAEVCEWAGREVNERGAGLEDDAVKILRREGIRGSSLFKLTDAELHSVGMTLGARKDLLAAVALLTKLPGTHCHEC